jgi:hypothetical protein
MLRTTPKAREDSKPRRSGTCRRSVVNFINILRAHLFCTKVLFWQNLTGEKLCKALSYEKRARKMLMKLTPG